MTSETDRREDKRDDHDLLTKIDANLSNFMRRFEDHAEDDRKNFQRLYDRTSWMQKIVLMGLGALALLNFLWQQVK